MSIPTYVIKVIIKIKLLFIWIIWNFRIKIYLELMNKQVSRYFCIVVYMYHMYYHVWNLMFSTCRHFV